MPCVMYPAPPPEVFAAPQKRGLQCLFERGKEAIAGNCMEGRKGEGCLYPFWKDAHVVSEDHHTENKEISFF